jgi:hypothetical protein
MHYSVRKSLAIVDRAVHDHQSRGRRVADPPICTGALGTNFTQTTVTDHLDTSFTAQGIGGVVGAPFYE